MQLAVKWYQDSTHSPEAAAVSRTLISLVIKEVFILGPHQTGAELQPRPDGEK